MKRALEFNTAFKYSFNRPMGMFNILWMFVPIIGWFALGGYGVRITQEFLKGKFKELPEMNFGEDLKLGWFMFLKAIPFFIAYIIASMILVGIEPNFTFVTFLFNLLVFPILTINFIKKMTIESFFEFKVAKAVFQNFEDYLMALLKSIGLGIIFLLMYIVLVGIPAGQFTKNIFFADFYRRNVK